MSGFTELRLNSANLARLLTGASPEGQRVHARVAASVERVAEQARTLAPEGSGYRTIVFDDTETPGGSGALPRKRLAVMLTHPDTQARDHAHSILLACLDAAR